VLIISETILKVENVDKKYKKFSALNQINFCIQSGEIVGLLGPNGAGKTTILKIISQLTKPSSGKVLIIDKNGELQDINNSPKNLIERGFLIDIPQFYDTNPYSLLKYIARLTNYRKQNTISRINFLLKKFDLYDWKYKKIKTFSKGMKQKLGFMVGIIHEPDLVILDEPQTGLDPESRILMRDFLKQIQSEGKSIIISSHMLNEIREICDKIVLINKGNLIGFDTIDNLEREFFVKEIICEISNPIQLNDVSIIMNKLEQELKTLIINTEDDDKNPKGIRYDSTHNSFIFRYDGSMDSRSKILNILSNKFSSDLTVSSFYEPKDSQLEKLYTQMLSKTK